MFPTSGWNLTCALKPALLSLTSTALFYKNLFFLHSWSLECAFVMFFWWFIKYIVLCFFLQNFEKTLIKPTAFKPVVPKKRNSSLHYLVQRNGVPSLSDSQGSINLLFNGNSIGTNDKHNSLSCRNSSISGTMSDSGRNSLSSLPTYSTGCSQQLEPVSISMSHINLDNHSNINGFSERVSRARTRPSNSDSGRSSSSKSTGSLSGRGNHSSDSGSCDRSPIINEEILIRELEEKLKDREMELQHLKENLDENEAAICQVGNQNIEATEIFYAMTALHDRAIYLVPKMGSVLVLGTKCTKTQNLGFPYKMYILCLEDILHWWSLWQWTSSNFQTCGAPYNGHCCSDDFSVTGTLSQAVWVPYSDCTFVKLVLIQGHKLQCELI